jgi:hypothetical protein
MRNCFFIQTLNDRNATRVLLILSIALSFVLITPAQTETRSLRGTIYFSNNTPPNRSDFPVSVTTSDQKTQIAETTLTEDGNFYLDDLRPGQYLLKIHNLHSCTLLYKVDIRRQSITNIRVVMDAACAHINGKVADLPKS